MIEQILSDGLSTIIRNTAYHGVKVMRLGKGQIPDTVVVPPAEQRQAGEMYVHSVQDGTPSYTTALNKHPSLPMDNAYANYPILVGYPQGSNQLCIIDDVPGLSQAFTGGALPMQLAMVQAAIKTPDRDPNLLLTETSPPSMNVRLAAGFRRFGNSFIATAEDTTFVDLTSHVPSATNRARWLIVTIDSSDTAHLYSGVDFDLPTALSGGTRHDYVPLPSIKDEFLLAAVMLYQGMADVRRVRSDGRVDIIPLHAMPAVQDPGMGIYVQSADPGAVGAKRLWIDTSGGDGNWIIKIRNLANTDWEDIAGSLDILNTQLKNFKINTYGGFIRSSNGDFVR